MPKYAASPNTVILWAQDLLQLVKQGRGWLHPPLVPIVAVGQGCSAPTAHRVLGDKKHSLGSNCFQQAEPAPIAALFPPPLQNSVGSPWECH